MSSAEQPQEASRRTVLLVEDHFHTRWGAAEYLRQAGYRVVEAINVPEALSIFKGGVHIDIVFSDINMPGGEDGYYLAKWLEENNPALPVLLTSGDPQNPSALSRNPLRRFIRKPYDPGEVEQILLVMLG